MTATSRRFVRVAAAGTALLTGLVNPAVHPRPALASGSPPCTAGVADVASAGGQLWFPQGFDSMVGSMSVSGQIGVQAAVPSTEQNNGESIAPSVAGTDVWATPPLGTTVEHVLSNGSVTTVATGLSDFRLIDVAPGPDGREWFLGGQNSLAAIDTAGRVTTYAPFGPNGNQGLDSITSGPDGALWAVGLVIDRFTTDGTLAATFDIGSRGSFAGDITTGSDGALWFTENEFESLPTPRIGRITTSGSITRYMIRGASSLSGLTSGPDGNLWFGYESGVGRITTSGDVTLFPVLAQEWPEQTAFNLASGPDGRVWFAADGLVGAITTAGVATLYGVPSPQPVACHLVPGMGDPAGGTTVRIFGRGLTGATAVSFGQTPAESFSVVRDNEVDAVAPPGVQGSTVDVSVTTASGTGTTAANLGYLYHSPPVVTSLSPSSGATAGGNTVTINGQNLRQETPFVTFGGASATNVQVVSDTQVTAVAPAHIAGVVDVVVTERSTASAITSGDTYTYVAPQPVVTLVQPGGGPLAGGNDVYIEGSGLTGATAVTFGGVPADAVESLGDGLVHCFAPAHARGFVDVAVTTAGGTSATTPNDRYLYAPPPAVTGVSPSSGPSSGGTVVTITGSDLSDATQVLFGAVDATSFRVDSDTQITAVSPQGVPGVTDVRVVTPVSASPPVAADQYRYTTLAYDCSVAQGTISTSPSSGGYTWSVNGIGSCTDVAGLAATYSVAVAASGTSTTLGVCGGGTLDNLKLDVALISPPPEPFSPSTVLKERFAIRVSTYPLASPFEVQNLAGAVVGAGTLITRLFARCPPQGSDTAAFAWQQSV